jgi:N-alpha-acetyltransferase 15/16, NatA auxiliary subunit
MAPPAIPPKRILASKEASLFKELLALYETRQLKKGQKIADQILKKYPEHGGMVHVSEIYCHGSEIDHIETLCMKGLILTHMDKRDEGIELVKKGVRLDLTSHICWHVFGLIQKAEKNYEEALKSYTQALRFDKVRVLESMYNIYQSNRLDSGQCKHPARRSTASSTTTHIRWFG